MQLYYRSPFEEMIFAFYAARDKIQELSDNITKSNCIHVIFVDNYDKDDIRKKQEKKDKIRSKIIPLVQQLIKTNKDEHVIIFYYDFHIFSICPVLQLNDNIVDTLLDRIWFYYFPSKDITTEMILHAINTKNILTKPEFKFLLNYQNINTYVLD